MLKSLSYLCLLFVLTSCQNSLETAIVSPNLDSQPQIPHENALLSAALAPSHLSAETVSPTQVKLRWQGQANHKSYTLYLNNEVVASQVTETQYLLQGLAPFSEYEVHIQAQLDGDSSPKSEPFKITTPYTDAAALEKIKATKQRLMAIEVYDNGIIALSAKKLDGSLANPDGTPFYASDLYLQRVTHTGEHTQVKLNQTTPLYLTENTELQSGALKIQPNGNILAFTNHKTKSDNYLMSGTLYSLAESSKVTEKVVFQDLNQGWFAYFQDSDLYHFSFTKYFLVKNTERQQDITPQLALETYQAKRKALSQGLYE